MTEDQAKMRWCPHVRLKVATGLNEAGDPIVDEPQTTFNRVAVNGENTAFILNQGCCIASACMSWRWQGLWRGRELYEEAGARRKAEDGDYEVGSVPVGFCGLAGRP